MTVDRTAPPPSRVAPVEEDFHGETVPDPFRWLEDGGAEEVRDWTAAQNRYTARLLESTPGREQIRRRLAGLLAIGMVGAPVVRGDRYFYQRRDGTQNQPVLYLRRGHAGEDRALLDPNALSAAGTVALDYYYPSRDGHLLAYGLSDNGSELSTLRVLDVDSGVRLGDEIARTRSSYVSWLPDGSGFYYTRLPYSGTVPPGEEQYHRKVFLHRLGADPRNDALIWSERRDMREQPAVQLSDDGRWLLLTVSLGWDRGDVYVRDPGDPAGGWVTVVEDEHATFSGEIDGETLYLHTNLGAPRYRVFAVPLAAPRRERWREVVPERADAILHGARVIGGRLALHYLVNAAARLELRTPDGVLEREIGLPAFGSLAGLGGERNGTELFYAFTSFTTPAAIFRLELLRGATNMWAQIAGSISPDDVEVRQVW